MLKTILYYTGIATWSIIILWLLLRLIFGKNWMLKVGSNLFLGSGLLQSAKKLKEEIKEGDINDDTVTEVAVRVFWRLTRLGVIGLIVAGLPTWLLFNQNRLITKQNTKIDLQNNLIEADRRSALILLMSNILDQVDSEIKALREEDEGKYDSEGYYLTDPLMGRIAALSQGFIPYKLLINDTLTKKAVSPERGQLLLALAKSNLDSITCINLNSISKFQQAYLREANLSRVNLRHVNLRDADLLRAELFEVNLISADLRGSDLRGANLSSANLSSASLSSANLTLASLSGANLRGAMLSGANLAATTLVSASLIRASLDLVDLTGAYLTEADLTGADLGGATLVEANLSGANLTGADLTGADLGGATLVKANLSDVQGFHSRQLKQASSLFECFGLDSTLENQLRQEKPCLFTERGCE